MNSEVLIARKEIMKVGDFGKALLFVVSLVITFALLINLASSQGNTAGQAEAIEEVIGYDEVQMGEDVQWIKNNTNRSDLPMITLGGVHALYSEGDSIAIFASVTMQGVPIDVVSYCNLTITQWNGSTLLFHLNSTNMTKITTGWYYLNWTVPAGAKYQGTYGILVEADPSGIRTQATAGFKVGLVLNVTITVDTSAITEQLDCDSTDDSPICNYTSNLNNVTSKIEDMLNCANNGNNSDICNYTRNLEANISTLQTLLVDVNYSMWNKLLTIESTTNTINSYVNNISDALNCDVSVNDVCTKINELRTFISEVNLTTHRTLDNVTLMLPQISDILSNVTDVKNYVTTLITEFNCTAMNPSDVCYRLELIQNATGPLAGILAELNVTLKEINSTTYQIYLNTVNGSTSDIISRLIELNSTTHATHSNVTWMVPKINEILNNLTEFDTYLTTLIGEFNCTSMNPSDVCYRLQDLAANISLIRSYSASLIDEFNCTAMNPSDVCYRLNTIEGYAILIDAKVSQINQTTQNIWNLLLSLNVTINSMDEKLDCDGIDDSPICAYTQSLQSSIDNVQDMLNCSNLGNNSDLCGYAERLELNISRLMDLVQNQTVNYSVWDKLLSIETTVNTINSDTTSIWEALDCDNSANDVCDTVERINTLAELINITTIDTLGNVTYIVSKVDTLLMNVTTIHDYVENLILEFNCTASNPSDVCYRLEIIQNATAGSGSLSDLLTEINDTIHETLTMVNYINEVRWGNFSYTQPVPTVLIVQGKIKRIGTDEYLSVGSVQVNITDAYVSTVMWSHEYDDVIRDNLFNIMIGGTHDLSLIPKRKYRRDISICDGITFDTNLYTCETFTTYFIA